MKKIAAALLLIAIGIGLGILLAIKTLGPDPDYWIRRAEYDRVVAEKESQIAASLEIIAAREARNSELLIEIQLHEERAEILQAAVAREHLAGRELQAETERLRSSASAAIAANPAVRALIENFDLRCSNYESQISLLGQEIEELRFGLEATQELGLSIQDQRDEWKRAYENERALRLASEGLVTELESSISSNKLWRNVGKGAVIAGAIFGAIKLAEAIGGK